MKLVSNKKQSNFDDFIEIIEISKPIISDEILLPIYLESVSAGFPSPADDYLESKVDLNQQLIKNPNSTFFIRVRGDSMIDAGIHSGDTLIVDKSINPKNDNIVIAVLNGELTVKRLKINENSLFLMPENENFKKIEIKPEMSFEIWGVVTNVIHSTL